MARRSKIIATIGPASENARTLKGMIEAGMDVARIGLAHGTVDEQIAKFQMVRAVAADLGRHVGIVVDLPGPKVRCMPFTDGGAELVEDTQVSLGVEETKSSSDHINVDYPNLLQDVQLGDSLSFGDGQVVVSIENREGERLKARVVHGGKLNGSPGLHVPSDRLRMSSPTDHDLELLDTFVEMGTDMVAVSFVRSAHDIRRLGVEPAPRGPMVIAKVETKAAVSNLEGIIEASGAVMVARGDLGSEMDIEELPHLQKYIIQECIALGRPAITATQMLESMVSAPTPTRAEASDIANAVFDGTSALMLSGETAIGRDPVNAVRTMARITARADEKFDYESWAEHIQAIRRGSRSDAAYLRVTDALTMAAARTATETDAEAIICLSRSGFTVRSVARFRPTVPLFGMTFDDRTANQLSLSWGTRPLIFNEQATPAATAEEAVATAARVGVVRSGDTVVVVSGSSAETHATDTLRVLRVP
ncbi:MAG: pyruvate kinase [Acidimicrobiaceae bacterium]|jgi:pyruvate kinase|nr:pyruvate kinase [Acidimicrobiaceae bacterium]MCH2633402.1 pyruvate kinase [Acidimicrobiales bacterium]HBV25950.1 pyruvate kinase [Acidimicrobiaceae bacterium]HCK75372.1 pyruvate kinase [Acidimicrobiaceae bacterium]|tara:strand:+ start:9290 stop:10723 length:1434 start_codon:yes stop_codon:yes gene_type:complete